MSVLIDSYNNTPYLGDRILGDADVGYGQSFSVENNYTLTNCKFSLRKFTGDSLIGNAYAKIYAHTGTYGTSSVPTGNALATSNAIDVSTLGTSFAWINFTFSGLNQISLSSGNKYVVAVEYTGSSTSRIIIELDASSPTHSGNSCYDSGSGYTAYQYWDLAFEVYGESPTTPTVGVKYPLPPFKRP